MTAIAPTVDVPYAGPADILDADSHVMELADWLARATPTRRSATGSGRCTSAAPAPSPTRPSPMPSGRAGDAARPRPQLEEQLLTDKGWHALGAFDPAERSRALDLLGFESPAGVPDLRRHPVPRRRPRAASIGGTRALNRAMADFCADDPRLVAVASVPWIDPADTQAAHRRGPRRRCGAVLVPSHPGRGISPDPPRLRPRSGRPSRSAACRSCCTSAAAVGRSSRRSTTTAARSTDFLGGGENIRAKDYMAIHQLPEQFLSAMVLDGIFEAHPAPARRLHRAGRHVGRALAPPARPVPGHVRPGPSPPCATCRWRRSSTCTGNLFFTPFPREPVGWMIEQCGDDLFLFSSRLPAPRGHEGPDRSASRRRWTGSRPPHATRSTRATAPACSASTDQRPPHRTHR